MAGTRPRPTTCAATALAIALVAATLMPAGAAVPPPGPQDDAAAAGHQAVRYAAVTYDAAKYM